MKKGLCFAALLALFLVVPSTSHAHSHDSDDGGHPLRWLAYALHPIGVALQDYIVRPVHRWISATPERAYWFGHDVREDEVY